MKFLIPLSFLLWCAPLVSVQASNGSLWGNIQLHSAFGVKLDNYKVYISGMHPSKQDGEMKVNRKAIHGTQIPCYLIRWHHAPSIYFERDFERYNDKDALKKSAYDPKGIFVFTGKGITLSGQLLVSMELLQLRIGAGSGIRCSFFKDMAGEWLNSSASDGGENNRPTTLTYTPKHSYYFTWTPLLRLGFKLIENKNYILLIDGTWAPCIYTFSELGSDYYWVYPRNFDLGATCEKQITRYINWSFRVAYSFCFNNEAMKIDEPSSPGHLLHVSHYIDGIIAQLGINIRMPKLSKCPIVGCHTKLDHAHRGKHYRGDSVFNCSC